MTAKPASPEAQAVELMSAGRLAEALVFADSALEVEKNAAVSFTASASQARRPIYRSSTGRWRPYRAQLEPLIAALRRAGVPQTELD